MRLCPDCGSPSTYSSTSKRGRICKSCLTKRTIEWRSKNPDRHKNSQLQRKFGISIEEYKAMEAAQGGLCAICKEKCSSGRALAVDHNHKTGKNRALLCGNCNRGIGNLRESPAILYRAIEYLNLHN